MELLRLRAGRTPLLVSMPHVGTHVPPSLAARMTEAALALPDTDWHLERLYDFLDELGATVLAATHSRYVIDLNRPPDDASLYPGQDTTTLLPLDTFAREPVYRPGETPGKDEAGERIERYWRPYHDRLSATLAALRAQHGYALLWDAHSIASEVPRFFAGRLADFNIGTAGGDSCHPAIEAAVAAAAMRAPGYTTALNGRFKGGYITRAYGRPAERIHAVQLELSERTYMDERPPFPFRDDLAQTVRPHLRGMLEGLLEAGRRARAA
jgi:N-formylglutamate deformylase